MYTIILFCPLQVHVKLATNLGLGIIVKAAIINIFSVNNGSNNYICVCVCVKVVAGSNELTENDHPKPFGVFQHIVLLFQPTLLFLLFTLIALMSVIVRHSRQLFSVKILEHLAAKKPDI